eukprot:g9040.t1
MVSGAILRLPRPGAEKVKQTGRRGHQRFLAGEVCCICQSSSSLSMTLDEKEIQLRLNRTSFVQVRFNSIGVDRARIPRKHIERRSAKELRHVNEATLTRKQLAGANLQSAIPRRLATGAERNAYTLLCPLPDPETVAATVSDCVVRSRWTLVDNAAALVGFGGGLTCGGGSSGAGGLQAATMRSSTPGCAWNAGSKDVDVAPTPEEILYLQSGDLQAWLPRAEPAAVPAAETGDVEEAPRQALRDREDALQSETQGHDLVPSNMMKDHSAGLVPARLPNTKDSKWLPTTSAANPTSLSKFCWPSSRPASRMVYDALADREDSWKTALYPSHPVNFTSLRPVTDAGLTPLDRAVRDVPWESRFQLTQRKVLPKYASEVRGTPRREYQEGLVDGMRVRPVFNPFVELTPEKRYRLDNWPSRNWLRWDPSANVHVRGGRRSYELPRDIAPVKDELGEWHPTKISGRYKADIEKQYAYFSLPWMWARDFYNPVFHKLDRAPKGKRRWRYQEHRKLWVADALRKMPQLIEDYRKERRETKRLSWFEDMMVKFCGKPVAHAFIRKRKRAMH